VLVADLDGKSGRAIADEITAQGGEAVSTRVDVADEASVQAMVALATKTYGRLDGTVNNAAITHPLAPITELDYATWDRSSAYPWTGWVSHRISQTPRRSCCQRKRAS
jgi:NAD(P)-dependent dehydrogenase (short-subunit alcohol dehydrogenase family)